MRDALCSLAFLAAFLAGGSFARPAIAVAAAQHASPAPSPSPSPSAEPAPRAVLGVRMLQRDGKVLVLAVTDPAATAGVQRGDIVESIDGARITSPAELLEAMRGIAPGDHVALVVDRGGTSMTLDVIAAARANARPPHVPSTIGVVFTSRTGPPVVAQIAPKSPADQAGLHEGDIVVSVDGTPMASGQAVHDAIAAHDNGDHVALVILRNGIEQNVMLAAVVEPPGFPVSIEDIPAVSGRGLVATRSTDARTIPPPAPDAPIVVLDQFQPPALGDVGTGYYGLTIENASRKTVTHILFLVEMLSPFAMVLESHAFVLSGEFSPGILIEANGSRGSPIMDATKSTSFNTNRPWFQMDNRHGPLFNRWVVRVVKVAFSDGDVWQASGTYPVIMPPPVAASTTATTTTGDVGLGFSLESLCSTPRC